jgi:hypothetical protein
MITNADITVFNFFSEQWFPCVIRQAWFHLRDAISAGTGLSENSHASLRIPVTASFSKEFISPLEFDTADKEGFFTLRPGDLIIKGICEFHTAKDYLMKNYQTCEIVSVADNRFGSISVQHWHILGK